MRNRCPVSESGPTGAAKKYFCNNSINCTEKGRFNYYSLFAKQTEGKPRISSLQIINKIYPEEWSPDEI